MRQHSARPVTLRAVAVEVGADAVLDRRLLVGERRGCEEGRDIRLEHRGVEEAEVVQGAELVVGPSRQLVGVRPVELVGVQPQHVAGRVGVAGQAFRSAGVMPVEWLHAAVRVRQGVWLIQAIGQEVRVASVRAPVVGQTVELIINPPHEEPCLQPAQHAGVPLVRGKHEVLHEHGPDREIPLAVLGERDPFPGC